MWHKNVGNRRKSRVVIALAVVLSLLVALSGCATTGLSRRSGEPTGSPTGSAAPGKPTDSGNPQNPTQGGNNTTPSAEPATPTPTKGTEPGEPTPTGSAATPTPTGSAPAKQSADELKKQYGSVLVTDVSYDNKRTDFYFTEDYEGFSSQMSWTLDLNGNTIVVTKPITVDSNVTITNGKVIVACEPGFRVVTDGSHSITFSGKKLGPLSISVIDGVAVYGAYQIKAENVEISVNGGAYVIPDTLSDWPSVKSGSLQLGKVKDTKVTVFDGCYILNRDSSCSVSVYDENTEVYVYENGIGIDNSGKLFVSGIKGQVLGGCMLYNHNEGLCTGMLKVDSVEDGTGVANDGRIEANLGVVVRSGTGIINKGYMKGSLELGTIPLDLFKSTLLKNTEEGEIDCNGYMYIFTGENSVAVDNSGILKLNGYMSLGVPCLKDTNMYTSSSLYHDFTELFPAFFESGNNLVTKCVGVLNRRGGVIAGTPSVSVNSTDSHGTLYTDKSIGIYNMDGAKLDSSCSFFLHGEDAVGLLNAAGAELTDSTGYYKIYVKAEPIDRDISSSRELQECVDAIGKESKYAKNCIGVVNQSGKMTPFSIAATMCGSGCIGFINEGHVGSFEHEGKYSSYHLASIEINMFGRDNTGFLNNGIYGFEPEAKRHTALNLSVYGSYSTALENKKELFGETIKVVCIGHDLTGLVNSGKLYSNRSVAASIGHQVYGKDINIEDCCLIDNRGSIEFEEKHGFIFAQLSSSKECTALHNGTTGSISCGGLGFSGTELFARYIVNEGELRPKYIGFSAGSYGDHYTLNGSEPMVFLNNSGLIETTYVSVGVDSSDFTELVNSGTINASERVFLSLGKSGGVSGENTGSIKTPVLSIINGNVNSGRLSGDGHLDYKNFGYKDPSVEEEIRYYDDGSHVATKITYDPEKKEVTGGTQVSYDSAGNVTQKQKYVWDQSRSIWKWVVEK